MPVEGRGSLPFALLHGESLVAVASWALGEAGVELLDFTASWADVAGAGEPPWCCTTRSARCTPASFIAEAVRGREPTGTRWWSGSAR